MGNARLVIALAAFALAPALDLGFAELAPAAQFGVQKWEAGTCTSSSCTEHTPELFYTQAAGHPPYGITDFKFNAERGLLGVLETPVGHVKDVRVDLPQGLAIDPEAVPTCSQSQIESSSCPPASQVGVDEATGAAGGVAIKESFNAYNMERKPGQSALVGVDVKSVALSLLGLESVVYLEGSLSWYREADAAGGESSGVTTGDYHEYFRIRNLPTEPELIESRLIFWGVPFEKNGGLPGTDNSFITMPSTCNGPQVTLLHVDSYEDPGHFLTYESKTPVGASGCELLAFKPEVSQLPETTRSDAPDGTEVIVRVPQGTSQPSKPNTPDLMQASTTLPEGMTLNPSAANGLEACADSQFKMGTSEAIECPAGSVIGSVAVDAPGIPNGSMTGKVYLGAPRSTDPTSGQEYRVLVAAEAPAYDVGVRLEGKVSANPQTGQLTTTFSNLPPVPFEDFKLKFASGAASPLANPLRCGPADTLASFVPYSGTSPVSASSPFSVDFDGAGGLCPVPPPFGIGQSARAAPGTAGSTTTFTLSLVRPEGEQYLSTVSTTLPEGLIGLIPAAQRCGEAQVAADACPQASRLGSASVTIGSGGRPYALEGAVYLTGPYGGAPFGLAIVTPATKVGPYDYGVITTRATIQIDPYTARVTASSALPTVIGGVPIRMRSLTITIDREGFMLNPTSCAPLSTSSMLTSTFGDTETLATPFQASGCGALAFAPRFSASTSAKTSRRRGASLTVSVAEQAHQANIRSVAVTLPRKLVARASTLGLTCMEKTFVLNPSACPASSKVGGASASTPALPGALTGPVYFVSHGGAAFPDLDIVLRGDGVTVVLVGNTAIRGAYTHSNFATLPDVPIHSFSLTLPEGSNSALSANGSLCRGVLRMPTTIIGQNGARIVQRVRVRVVGCKHHKRRHRRSKHRHHRNRR